MIAYRKSNTHSFIKFFKKKIYENVNVNVFVFIWSFLKLTISGKYKKEAEKHISVFSFVSAQRFLNTKIIND